MLFRSAGNQQVDPSEPFLAPGSRFDRVAPRGDLRNWVLAAALEEFERIVAFSSFFTGALSQHRLAIIHELGFAGPEMQRRLDLLRRRFAL